MCGISVIIDRGASPDAIERLLRMHAEIRHRGPDGERFVLFGRDGQTRYARESGSVPRLPLIAAMAFRRLNVIDLSEAAAQPMSSADGMIWLTFNGEIYNFRELRARLSASGREFRTHGDSEVVLAAYEAWGTRCFEELDGMWGIVVADLRRRLMVASRDRFGIKPLHWCADGDRILIASEAKQIVAARDERPRAHAPLVTTYLRGNRIPVLDETFFAGIRALPPASWVEIPLDESGPLPEPKTFWDFGAIELRALSARDYARSVDELEATLRHAVETHNVADVNVGYLLSGGLDSSTLTGIMARDAHANGTEPAPTFSFGFRDARALPFSELQYAETVARKYDLTLHETTFDGRWVSANAGRIMRAIEEPVLGMPALAQFRVFEFCREHGMTVVIDGEASDEVFAGYPSYQLAGLRDHLDRGEGIRFATELHAMAKQQEQTSLGIIAGLVAQKFRNRTRGIYAWLDPSYGARRAADLQEIRAALADHGRPTSRMARLLFRDVKWGNVKIVLGYTDRVSMANSIEARVPFLDRRLVELAFSLPDEFKAGDGQRKRILRDVGRRYLPAQVTERKDRMGFGTPDTLFIRGEMWADVEARVRSLGTAPAFVPGQVDRFVDDFAAGRNDDVRAIWRMYALARWAEEFGVTS
jgi:asparagine synthase (glutamine-hydrolysing)